MYILKRPHKFLVIFFLVLLLLSKFVWPSQKTWALRKLMNTQNPTLIKNLYFKALASRAFKHKFFNVKSAINVNCYLTASELMKKNQNNFNTSTVHSKGKKVGKLRQWYCKFVLNINIFMFQMADNFWMWQSLNII